MKIITILAWIILIMALVINLGHATDMVIGKSSMPGFGVYSQKYLDRQDARRWRQLCKGGGRYQAMAEAYDKGKPHPCK